MIKSSTIEDGAPNYILVPFISQVLTYQASTVLSIFIFVPFFNSSLSPDKQGERQDATHQVYVASACQVLLSGKYKGILLGRRGLILKALLPPSLTAFTSTRKITSKTTNKQTHTHALTLRHNRTRSSLHLWQITIE